MLQTSAFRRVKSKYKIDIIIKCRPTDSKIMSNTYYYEYAGFWIRVLAFVIDMILWSIICGILAALIIEPLKLVNLFTSQVIDLIAYFGALLIYWVYFAIFESSKWQATPGKKLLGLKVTDLDSERIGFGRANARNLLKIPSFVIFYIGVIMVAFTRYSQGLHDLVAKTLVVKKTRSRNLPQR